MAEGLPLKLDKVLCLQHHCMAVVNQNRWRLDVAGYAPDPIIQSLFQLFRTGIGEDVMPNDTFRGEVLLQRDSRKGIMDPLLSLSLAF